MSIETIYTIGASMCGTDYANDFAKNNLVGIGHDPESYPDLIQAFADIPAGNIIVVKSSNPHGSYIKNIHLLTDGILMGGRESVIPVSVWRKTRCIWAGKSKDQWIKYTVDDGMKNLRMGTLAVELSPTLKKLIMEKIEMALNRT